MQDRYSFGVLGSDFKTSPSVYAVYKIEEIWQTIPHEGETVMLVGIRSSSAQNSTSRRMLPKWKELWTLSVLSVTAVQ